MVSWPLAAASAWFSNQAITAPVMQTNVTDPLNDLNTRVGTVSPTAPPVAKMTNSTGQSIPNNTNTACTWDTETFDTVSGHSTSSNTSRYVCQTGYAGLYRVIGSLYWTANATGVRRVLFAVNGTVVEASANSSPASATQLTVETETMIRLAVGDYIEAWAFQTSGGALTLSTSGAGSATMSWFEVQWISS